MDLQVLSTREPTAYEQMLAAFESEDWAWKDERAGCVQLDLSGQTGSWRCLASVREDPAQFCFTSHVPSRVPVEKRPLAAELLVRANHQLGMAYLSMDFATGAVSCRTLLEVEHVRTQLTVEIIVRHVRYNLEAMDYYYAGIMALIHGDKQPAEIMAGLP